MSDAPPFKYRRLPGRGNRTRGGVPVVAARSSLWLAPDHLLSVDRLWMNEEYKRFYFRDIQAITLQRTNSASAWNWVFGSLAFVIAGIFALVMGSSWSVGGIIAVTISAGFFLLLLAINLLRGPTCTCKLRTAVQTEVLPSLGRVHSARKAIAIIKPLIEGVQGGISPADIYQATGIPSFQAAPQTSLAGFPVTAPIARGAAPPPVVALPPSRGMLHAILYILLLLDAATGFYRLLNPNWRPSSLIGAILMLCLCGLSFTAMIRQRKFAVSIPLRHLTTGTFIGVLAEMLVIFIYSFIARVTYSITHPGRLPTQMDFLAMPGYKTFLLISHILQAAAGIAGLALIAAWISRNRQPAATPTAFQPEQQPTQPASPEPPSQPPA